MVHARAALGNLVTSQDNGLSFRWNKEEEVRITPSGVTLWQNPSSQIFKRKNLRVESSFVRYGIFVPKPWFAENVRRKKRDSVGRERGPGPESCAGTRQSREGIWCNGPSFHAETGFYRVGEGDDNPRRASEIHRYMFGLHALCWIGWSGDGVAGFMSLHGKFDLKNGPKSLIRQSNEASLEGLRRLFCKAISAHNWVENKKER